jgi:hypothetical protein
MIRRLRVEQQLRASALTGIMYFKFLLMCTHQQFSHAHYLSDTRKHRGANTDSITSARVCEYALAEREDESA